jgi:hypothetical protein
MIGNYTHEGIMMDAVNISESTETLSTKNKSMG